MKRYTILLTTFALAFALTPFAIAEELKIGAGAAPFESVLKPIKAAFEKATGITLNLINSGPKNAMVDLERGTLNAAAAGLSLEQWVELMKKEGAPVADPASLVPETVGKDRIVVITHHDNPVKTLSKEQLQGIFSGTTTNWKDVGGKDEPVLVVWGSLIQGTNSFFGSKIMDGKPFTKEVLESTTAYEIKQAVAANPPAIGIGPASIVDASINSPTIPEISRPITIVTKGKPSPAMQKLYDFIKGEGQKYIKK